MTELSKSAVSGTGVFLCTCQHPRDGAAWAGKIARSLAGSLPEVAVFPRHDLCASVGLSFAAARVKRKKLEKVLLAGCAALQSLAYGDRLSRGAGIPRQAIDSVRLPPGASAAKAAAAIRRAASSLELVPAFATTKAALGQSVLVVGGGRAGWETARLLAGLGYPVTVAVKGVPPAFEQIRGVEVLARTTLLSLTGSTGKFSARLSHHDRAGSGTTRSVKDAASVVIAEDTESAAPPSGKPFVAGRVLPLAALEGLLEKLPKRQRPPHVVIVLDYRIDEGTTGCEAAFHSAMAVRDRFHAQVEIVLRDARVAAYGLEALYDGAQERGVTFMKHDGRPTIRAGSDGVGVSVRFRDAVLGEEIELLCDAAAVGEGGLPPRRDDELAEAAGISQDAYGRLQENNVHLLPTLTNRAGVFLASPGHEQDAAFCVHSLLSPGKLAVELSHPVVDADKCALCLTCVRSCPFKAMGINEKEKKAECIPESCRRCGICAAECPARAITLPGWSDERLLAASGAWR